MYITRIQYIQLHVMMYVYYEHVTHDDVCVLREYNIYKEIDDCESKRNDGIVLK